MGRQFEETPAPPPHGTLRGFSENRRVKLRGHMRARIPRKRRRGCTRGRRWLGVCPLAISGRCAITGVPAFRSASADRLSLCSFGHPIIILNLAQGLGPPFLQGAYDREKLDLQPAWGLTHGDAPGKQGGNKVAGRGVWRLPRPLDRKNRAGGRGGEWAACTRTGKPGGGTRLDNKGLARNGNAG